MKAIQVGLLCVSAVALLVLGFNNCSQVAFTESDKVSSDGEALDGDPQVPPTADEAIANCADAERNGKLLTLTKELMFEDSKDDSGRAQVCEFGVGDNLGQAAEKLQARFEQRREFKLPAGAVLCKINLDSSQQQFRYDDVFFLNFNSKILASNNKTAVQSRIVPEQKITSEGSIGFYSYNWPSLRGASFANVADDYCLGKDQGLGTCSWPVSEQQGTIRFSFESELLARIGLEAFGKTQVISFVVTGDDDPSLDCYHEALKLSVQASYYLVK